MAKKTKPKKRSPSPKNPNRLSTKDRSPDRETYFARIIRERDLDLTVVAKRANIGRATMWRYRAGAVVPRDAQLRRLAEVLCIDVGTLAKGMGALREVKSV